LAALAAAVMAACRWQSAPTESTSGQYGGPGSNYTVQCSGDFPDWISDHPPATTTPSFELAQSYPLGVPVFNADNTKVDHWDPPTANQDAPWRAYNNLSNATQRTNYLDALRDYFLQGMSDADTQFDAVKNNNFFNGNSRHWFHVPMMTAVGNRREPYHGVTVERALRPSEQTHWLNGSDLVNAVAVGYYNELGGYAIGQVFPSYDLTKTNPAKAKFIDGAFVFKVLFAQYLPSRIKAPDPLAHAPSWQVLDLNNTSPTFNTLIEVRLLQVDVAVKDDHFASTTGWVFATYVYDESKYPSETNAWKRLAPVGIQWGNDPTVTTTSTSATLNETWLNPSRPAAFLDHVGRAGRLIGPVDNPASSCLSCHSTGEVDMSQANGAPNAFDATAFIPPNSCSDPMDWFRNLPSGAGGSTPFGKGLTCPVNTSTAGLTATDYSLQIQAALQSVFPYHTPNPCAASAKAYHDANGDAEATNMMMAKKLFRGIAFKQKPGKRERIDVKDMKLLRPQDVDESQKR